VPRFSEAEEAWLYHTEYSKDIGLERLLEHIHRELGTWQQIHGDTRVIDENIEASMPSFYLGSSHIHTRL
jgi:hypothetical protein